jgi:uncharacterized damage-inducible protein DinB
MTDLRAEHAAREAEAWDRFLAALDRIPRERWEEPGVLPGWTLKEALWHVAGWLRECAESLEAIGEDRYVDEGSTDEETDARNAALAAEARGMSSDEVWAGVLDARELVLRRWHELPEIAPLAVEALASETYDHYAEHLPDLERFAR